METLSVDGLLGTSHRCFGCSPRNPAGLKLQFHRDGDEIVTEFVGREGLDGPPGVLHGGLQATLADELGAWTVLACKGRFGLTVSLQFRFLRPAKLLIPIEGRAKLVESDDKTAVVRITLRQGQARLLTGTATYLIPTAAAAEHLLGGPLPEAWRGLTRKED